MSVAGAADPSRGEVLAFRLGRILLGVRSVLGAIAWVLILRAQGLQSAAGVGIATVAIILTAGPAYLAATMRSRGGWPQALTNLLLFLDLVVFAGLVISGNGVAIVPAVVIGDVLAVMALSVRDIDRIRGGGWLDCSSCGEHAFQDVVDRLRFVRFFGYRLGIIFRRRDLVCRRCRHRRPATRKEIDAINTAGTKIGSAWLAPMGLLGLLLTGSIVYFGFIATPAALATPGITYNTISLQADLGAPLQMDEPNGWNHEILTDSAANLKYLDVNISTSGGRTDIKVRRIPGVTTLPQLTADHFRDEASLQSPDYPTTLPKTTCTKVAGEKAATLSITYTYLGDNAKVILFAFVHQNTGYVVEFTARQVDAVGKLDSFAQVVINSMKFVGSEPAPSGTASPTATGTPLAGTGASPTPDASGTTGAGSPGGSAAPAGSATPTIAC